MTYHRFVQLSTGAFPARGNGHVEKGRRNCLPPFSKQILMKPRRRHHSTTVLLLRQLGNSLCHLERSPPGLLSV